MTHVTLPFLLILCFAVNFSAAVNLGIYDCPSPWLEFSSACYKFDRFPTKINDAKQNCAIDGATLVSVNDAEEDQFIVTWLSTYAKLGVSWFTAGTRDPGATGPTATVKFTWTDGDQTPVVGAQFWFADSHRVFPGDRIVYYTDGSSWGWSVVDDRNVSLPYICEIPKEFIYKIVTVARSYDYGLAEIDPVNLPRGPFFIRQPNSTIYDVMSTLTTVNFVCEVSANPFPSYLWYVTHDQVQKPVNLTDQSKTVTNGRLSIVKPSTTQDNGDYECLARNSYGAVLSDFATLSFGYLNDFPKSQRDPVKANAYTGIGIQCYPPATGYAILSYTWYKESILNLIRPSVKWYIFVSSDGTLYFQSVTRDDQGNYFCMVTRPNAMDNFQEGKVSMPIPLQVTEAVGSTQDPQIVNSFPKAFPASPMVGDNLRIECVAWGTEILTYSWTRVGAAMPSGAFFSDYSRVLTINNVQLAHGGTYGCSVARRFGQATYKETTISIEASPYFTIPIENQFVDAGQTAVFRCYANGVPPVQYGWFVNATKFNMSLIPPSERSRYTLNSDGNILTITNVKTRDNGMFQCSASNTHGTKLCSGELRSFAFAPTFRKYPLPPNMYGIIGGNITLICQPEAAPEATKEWLKDGQPFSGSPNPLDRVVQLPNGNIHITGLEQGDGGNYTCTASNIYGTDSTTGQLTILPETTVIYPPKDTVVIVNQTTFLACQASYNPAIDITYDWWHNSYKIMFIKVKNLGNTAYVWMEKNYERGTGINRGGLYIRDTQFYHAGEYRCVVKSTTDELTFKSTLTVTGPPGMPAGVLGYNAQATSVELSWWPSKANGQPVLYYVIEIYNVVDKYWSRSENSSNIPASIDTAVKMSAIVTGLNPYTQYQLRVIGVNSIGEGTPSDPSPIIQTTEAPPITYPKDLGGGGGKVGTLNITWTPMSPSEYNANPNSVGYIVSWKKQDMEDDQWDSATINDPTVLKHVVTVGSQNYYLPYDIRIQAFNPSGKGPMSPTVTIMSAEDLPKVTPINVKAVYYNCTAIMVEWDPVADTRESMGGRLHGYRINYWVDVEQNETMGLFKIIHNQTDHGLIIALRENTWYMINVQPLNSINNGPKSENYRTRTLRAAPMEAPQDVRVSFVNYNSVLLQWRGVYTTILEEPLEGYTVRYWLRGENIYVATNLDAGKAIRYVLSGLKQQVMYEVRVFGYSRGGDGLQSSPTLEFVLGTDCDISEDSPEKEYVYTCRGCRLKVSLVLILCAWLVSWLQQP